MYELLKLLGENDLALTSNIAESHILVSVISTRQGEEMLMCAVTMNPQDLERPISDLITIFFKPAALAIEKERV